MQRTNPRDQYAALYSEVGRLQATLCELLRKHERDARGRPNWCHVGDMGRIVDGLSDLVDFLSDEC